MHRRQFLVGAAAMMAAAPTLAKLHGNRRRWGVQLFTVIAPLEQDFEGTLHKVSAFGYKEVETIGSFGRDPAYVRGLLDRCGLVSPSQHIASDELYGSFGAWARRQITTEQNRQNYVNAFQVDKSLAMVEGAIRQAKVIGQQYIVWPILMPSQLATRDILESYIKIFNQAGAMCHQAGLTFSFHNHDREFARIGNDLIYDLILAETDPATVKMEMDFYWITKAKADPIAYLSKHPGRFKQAHVKDMAPDGDFRAVGKGVIDIPKLIAKARSVGVEHFYVEYDRSADPLAEVGASIAFLDTLK